MSHKPVEIPPLVAGGIMLSYHCSNACRHCLYRCSPAQPDEWMSLETADRIFHALAREHYLESLHIAGGEATLQFDRLLDIIQLTRRYALPVAYLETNAAWCTDDAETRDRLEFLKAAGLPAILVSASIFHNEFVPFDHTRRCVEIAREVFGRAATHVWLPDHYNLLADLPNPEKPRSLDALCQLMGWAPDDPRIPQSYQVIPGGRAPQALRMCYRAHAPESFRGERCQADLLSTTHFHIDLHGNLFTGMCAGIAPGKVGDLHPEIAPADFPAAATLIRSGPYGLMREAMDRSGFEPRETGYVSKCDLCYDVRRHLHAHDPSPELRPDAYYATGEPQTAGAC